MLEDFQTGTASMARKRHLASSARGFYGLCLAPSIRKLIRSIRLIRGRIESSFTADTGVFPDASPFHFLLKGARRNIPHDEPLG